ncbi:MAG: beta-galactosidase [Anaerolineae bacterium]
MGLPDAGFNAVAAYRAVAVAPASPDVSDVDGHTHPMRNLAGSLTLPPKWALGHCPASPYIMAETINEGIPPWVLHQYPRASFIDQTGATQNIASYLQLDFLRCVEGWYRAVFGVLTPRQVTHGGRIIMVQLDNEMARSTGAEYRRY